MRLLSVREAAEQLGLSTSVIYGLCARRLLQHERHGLGRGVIRISEEALVEYRQSVLIPRKEPQSKTKLLIPPPKLKHLRIR